MSTITLPNIRVGSDLQVRVRLKDGGVAIDWSTLSNIKACIYSDAQRALAGRCAFSIDAEDNTLLVCTYAANKPQYLGVNRIVISAKYMGETKTYDKPAFSFVRWTADQEGEEITIDDPDVDVEISVEDVSSSILQEAVDAAFSAADRANEAAEAAEHMVDIHTGPAGKSAYEVAVEEGYTGTEEEWLASLKGDTGETPDISIGTVTTVAPGTPASASMTGTPEEPVLNLSIPQGVVGATPNFTVGTVTTGEPGSSVIVTITGTPEAPVLNLTIPQGMQGNTGSSVDYPYELVNNLTTDDATRGLTAAQGKVLDGKVSQLEAKVDELEDGYIAPSYTLMNGAINTNGSVGSGTTYKHTTAIPVKKGQKVKVSTAGYAFALISKDENGTYTPQMTVDSGDANVPATYIWTAPSDMNISVSVKSTIAFSIGIETDYLQRIDFLEAKVDEIDTNINLVSDNMVVNGFFKELYLIGVNYQDVASINVQGYRSSQITCIFKDSENNTLASLKSNAHLSDTFISQDHSGKMMLASVDWDNLDSVKAVVNACSLTGKVGNLGKNPNIVEFLSRRVVSNTIPTYTKTTGYIINSNGEVISAGSSHFYTSPIAVKGGDCIRITTYSRAGAAIISLTDGRGSFYKPIAIYTGKDPDTYFYKVDENGFVAFTGYNNEVFRLTVFRDSEIAKIYDKFKENEDATIAEMKSTPVDLRKRDSSVYVGADIDADWDVVDGATKTNSIQYNNVTRKKVRCATIVGPSNNGIARVGLTKSVNANLHPFLFSICIGDYSDIENAPAGDVHLLFYSGQGFVSSQRMKIPLQTATQYPEYNPVFNRNGWFGLCAFLPSCDGQGVEVGQSFDPTNVTGFGVYLVNSRNLPVTVHIERMDFLDVVMTKPGIVTIIDNFNPQVPAMADYAYSKGVRLNLSIIPGYYEGAPGAPTCASKEEIARLAAQGHFIWNHTWSHPNFNDITVPQIHDQINLAERWMQLNGYGEGKRIVSIPSARFNTRSCNAALDTNVEMFFHSWVREAKQVYIPFAPVARLLPTTWLDTDALAAEMSGTDIATVALKCLTYNGLTVIGFHGTYITNEGGGTENWQAYIDAIAASNAYHYGLDEILEGGWN